MVLEHVEHDVRAHGNHLTTGNLCSRYLIEVLFLYGRADVAFDLLTQTTYPSWGYMIENGATTYWERWEKIETDDQSPMASYDHPMLGSCCVAFHKEIAGIRAVEDAPGFAGIMIRPCIPPQMNFARSVIQSRSGRICSEWCKTEDGLLTLSVDIPFNCKAEICVPLCGKVPESVAVSESGKTIYTRALPCQMHRSGSSAGKRIVFAFRG